MDFFKAMQAAQIAADNSGKLQVVTIDYLQLGRAYWKVIEFDANKHGDGTYTVVNPVNK